MKYEHPTIHCETPAPGHYLIHGHAPRPVLLGTGYLVPPGTVHISPELPSAVLRAILEDRGESVASATTSEEPTPATEPGPVESGTGFPPVVTGARGRSSKAAATAEAKPKAKGRRKKAAVPAANTHQEAR